MTAEPEAVDLHIETLQTSRGWELVTGRIALEIERNLVQLTNRDKTLEEMRFIQGNLQALQLVFKIPEILIEESRQET